MADYDFTTDWFVRHEPVWTKLLDQFAPSRILEVGSFEGRSACFMVERCAARRPLELHCIDIWSDTGEYADAPMSQVEARFDANLAHAQAGAAHPVELHKHKSGSVPALARMIAEGREGYFDLVYVDGAHTAPAVLADAVLGFRLLKVGGAMVFDDYLWQTGEPGRQDAYDMPKPAIDAFVNIYQRKLMVMGAPLYQLYVRKTGD